MPAPASPTCYPCFSTCPYANGSKVLQFRGDGTEWQYEDGAAVSPAFRASAVRADAESRGDGGFAAQDARSGAAVAHRRRSGSGRTSGAARARLEILLAQSG